MNASYTHPVVAQRAIRQAMRDQVKRTIRAYRELIGYQDSDVQRLSHLVEMYELETGVLAIMTGVSGYRINEWIFESEI